MLKITTQKHIGEHPLTIYLSKTRRGEKDLVVFLAKQIFLHHASADRVIKVLVLLECSEGDRAIDLLEIAEPENHVSNKNGICG